ncbi:MAG TPA: lipopolysaccharide biosynthesis protein [Actinopolymorphaceae bacterium]|jgi:PST family polysaccharide transporter
MSALTGDANELSYTLRRSLTWSALSTITLRLGTFAVGVVVARLLAPDEFGIYAIALTVQTILITLADLGLSADLIRCGDPERRAPTVAALGLASGAGLTAAMAVSATFVARSFGAPDAAPVIALLSLTLLLSGAGTVPYAMLIRRFEQKKLFALSLVDFTVSTAITIALLAAGLGVISLAIARVATQALVLVLQFVLARVRPRVHVNRELIKPVLAFGLPVAIANLVSWAVLSVDNIVVSRMLGPLALGYYALAFNVSSWPMTAIGQVIRSVALPAFSRLRSLRRDLSLVPALSITWALALPAGAILAVLSRPLVEVVYGNAWLRAASVLPALALFGALRVVFDLIASFLYSRGASRTVLWIQLTWFGLLIPSIVLGAWRFGLVGAAWAHVLISFAVILPLYLWAARRAGADLRNLARLVWPPVLVSAVAAALALLVADVVASPLLAFLLGGVTALVVYFGLLRGWLRARISDVKQAADVRVVAEDETTARDRAADVGTEAQLPSAIGREP